MFESLGWNRQANKPVLDLDVLLHYPGKGDSIPLPPGRAQETGHLLEGGCMGELSHISGTSDRGFHVALKETHFNHQFAHLGKSNGAPRNPMRIVQARVNHGVAMGVEWSCVVNPAGPTCSV